MKVLVVALAIIAVTHTKEPKLPSGLTCEKVYEHYERWAWAGKSNIVRYLTSVLKYSAADIAAVEKCLRSR